MIASLQKRYEDYLDYTKKLEAKASFTDGLLGFGRDPKKDAGHEDFYNDVEQWATRFLASEPASADVDTAVTYMLQAADLHRENDLAYWFLYAAQGHAQGLIPLMSSPARASLSEWYEAHYPKINRMPVQKKVAKLLKKK